jgi:hypothetical protein
MKTRTILPWFIFLLAGLVSWTAFAQSSRAAAPRPTWDYKLVTYVSASSTFVGYHAQMSEDGIALDPAPTGMNKLKELGAQGWELVAVVGQSVEGGRTETRCYLKRPN